MGSRSVFTDREALQIATKLDAELEEGRKHQRATVRLNGQFVGSFGIRRGQGLGHDYVPKQIQATTREAINLARCPLSKEDFTETLVKRGAILALDKK